MIDLSNVKHHPCIEELTNVLCNKTQNTDRGFFKAEIAFFLAKMASAMRAYVRTKDRGDVPVNLYVIALANSGLGKGYSVNIMETKLISGFKKRFVESTMNIIAETSLWDLANDKAVKLGTDPQTEYDNLYKEYTDLGTYLFEYDSGTSPAVKQLRQKLLLGNCGSLNLQIDEIGANLIGATEVLNTYLELFDQGLTKSKLIKNTSENKRGTAIDGKTPANMLLFGTPTKLFDGSQTEDLFYSFLDMGYARRCLFGIGHNEKKAYFSMSPADIYKSLIDPSNENILDKWANVFSQLADPMMYNWEMELEDNVAIKLIEYRINCEKVADTLPDHEEIHKAELAHRYFKALKLAGAFAFIDKSNKVTLNHLLQAILLVEESGEAFKTILTREKSYMKLARYIASIGTEVTHADLTEKLPFYKSTASARNEMMNLAIAWGYKQHIIIKKSFIDGIEFFSGESLQNTDINQLLISTSDNFAYNYEAKLVPFDAFTELAQAEDQHWCNHEFHNNHRTEENAIPGFNTIVLDVDGTLPMDIFKDLFKEYKFFLHTTKRHTEESNRYRVVIPINYILKLDSEEYKEFMNNIINWLPFTVDESCNQRSKKWMTTPNASYYFNDGKLLDVLQFIPKTSKNEQYQKEFQKIESMDNLERWFASRIAIGNRNNQMLKFALALVDSGLNQLQVEERVKSFNKKLNNPISESELQNTIFRTVATKYIKS